MAALDASVGAVLIGSSSILLRSGVGPLDALCGLDIPVVHVGLDVHGRRRGRTDVRRARLSRRARPARKCRNRDRAGAARLGDEGFLVGDDRLWFHTSESPNAPAPFLRVAREGREVAVMVATFDPPADVRQVRMVAVWTPKWERQATLGSYRLWAMSPDRGMAVSYPGLGGLRVRTPHLRVARLW